MCATNIYEKVLVISLTPTNHLFSDNLANPLHILPILICTNNLTPPQHQHFDILTKPCGRPVKTVLLDDWYPTSESNQPPIIQHPKANTQCGWKTCESRGNQTTTWISYQADDCILKTLVSYMWTYMWGTSQKKKTMWSILRVVIRVYWYPLLRGKLPR